MGFHQGMSFPTESPFCLLVALSYRYCSRNDLGRLFHGQSHLSFSFQEGMVKPHLHIYSNFFFL